MNSFLLRSIIKAEGKRYLAVQGDQLVQQDLVSKEKTQISLDFTGCILQWQKIINRTFIRTETMKKCIFYTNKWNCYGVWINQCPIYYLNFHPVAIKMLGASWTGEITRMPLTTEEMECKRSNHPLTFHTANWDCLCQISSRTRSRQKVPWESDSGTLLPDTSMLEGSVWLDRGVWGPSSCTASVCVWERFTDAWVGALLPWAQSWGWKTSTS